MEVHVSRAQGNVKLALVYRGASLPQTRPLRDVPASLRPRTHALIDFL